MSHAAITTDELHSMMICAILLAGSALLHAHTAWHPS